MEHEDTNMESLRADLIRRARIERHGELDPNAASHRRGHSASRFLRPPFPRLFRRNRDSPATAPLTAPEIESPKSPDPRVAAHPSNPFRWPYSRGARAEESSIGLTRPRPTHAAPFLSLDLSTTDVAASGALQNTPTRANNGDGATNVQTSPISDNDPGSQQHGHHQHPGSHAHTLHDPRRCRRPRQRFLLCFPWVRSKRVRTKLLYCFVSALILILLVAVYLGLLITKKAEIKEATIIMVLVIFLATILFFYCLVRLCLMVMRVNREAAARARRYQKYGPRGYVVPSEPIPVYLAQDEEEAEVESESPEVKPMPPAYGRWRESVRVDPDRIFWQLNTSSEPLPGPDAAPSMPRPPSYVSDDGVSYVVEAVPRSTAPGSDVPLPPHPSEAGRMHPSATF